MASTSTAAAKDTAREVKNVSQTRYPESNRLLRRLIKKFEGEKSGDVKILATRECNLRAQLYTGLSQHFLMELSKGKVNFKTIRDLETPVVVNELYNFCFDKHKYPTTKEFHNFITLKRKYAGYIDIGQFRNIIAKMGLVWRKIPKYGFVVVERPIAMFGRHTYLKELNMHRENKKLIVYIDECIIEESGDSPGLRSIQNEDNTHERVLYGVSKEGVYFINKVSPKTHDYFYNWLQNFKNLPSNAVIVIAPIIREAQKVIVQVPTIDSLKDEIQAWLEYHNIPYDKHASKYELFHLCETATEFKKLYKIDIVIKRFGLDVLHTPDSVSHLTPTTVFRDELNKNFSLILRAMKRSEADFDQEIMRMVRSLADGNFFDICDNYVKQQEFNMLDKDRSIDAVLDGVIEAMQTMERPNDEDSDVPSLSDCE